MNSKRDFKMVFELNEKQKKQCETMTSVPVLVGEPK
jgi:hypothetical protein